MDSKHNRFSFRERLNSFKYAFNGLKILIQEEHNARIHFFISIVVCILGFVFKISMVEWIAILILSAIVIGMEIINSAIERICNFISPEWNENIKQIKDLASLAVLVVSIVAVICGLIIFLPKIYQLLFE